MQLAEINKRINETFVKPTNENVKIVGDQVSGWWEFEKADCNPRGDDSMGYFKDIKECELAGD